MLRRAALGLFSLALVAFLAMPATAVAQDAELSAELTYVGPGPGGFDIYRFDYTLTNNAVTPAVIELLVFFDSDPAGSGTFTGDNSDFNNFGGFLGSTTSPANWTADVFEDADPNPWLVDWFVATNDTADQIQPGETLGGFSITFLWKGPGLPPAQFFEAINGFAHEGTSVITSVFQPVTGQLLSGCDGSPLSTVPVDLLDNASGFIGSTLTDANGGFGFFDLPPGNYSLIVSTPLGYADAGEIIVTPGQPAVITLECAPGNGDIRTQGFWKHQAVAHIANKNGASAKAQVSLADYVAALDLVTAHFAGNAVNPIALYTLPASASEDDKLSAAYEILLKDESKVKNDKAQAQLMALLLNVANGRIHQTDVISDDGATVSQAITFLWDLITDGDSSNDGSAQEIASLINEGRTVAAGRIPLSTPTYTYEDPRPGVSRITTTALVGNFPNPVRAAGTDIRFRLAEAGTVRLDIFDVQGRRVQTLLQGPATAGENTVRWDGRSEAGESLSRGIYFYRLESGDGVFTQKLILTD